MAAKIGAAPAAPKESGLIDGEDGDDAWGDEKETTTAPKETKKEKKKKKDKKKSKKKGPTLGVTRKIILFLKFQTVSLTAETTKAKATNSPGQPSVNRAAVYSATKVAVADYSTTMTRTKR